MIALVNVGIRMLSSDEWYMDVKLQINIGFAAALGLLLLKKALCFLAVIFIFCYLKTLYSLQYVQEQ